MHWQKLPCGRMLSATSVALGVTLLSFSATLHARPHEPEFYLSTNPLAALATARWNSGNVQRLLSLASNLEQGGSINGTLRFHPRHAVELRFSAGEPVSTFVAQVQPAYHFYFADRAQVGLHGSFYTGFHCRTWSYRNAVTNLATEHVAPGLHFGYWLTYERFLLDLRISQPAAIYSTGPGDHAPCPSAFSCSRLLRRLPALPVLGINLGWRFGGA